MSVVKKKKHVSKKNKKAWRKHCDIRDVEEFLEDQRLEERLGKFSTKPDDELFVVDTVGTENQESSVADDQPILSSKQRKRALLGTTPKCFEVFLSTSKVQDPNAKRNHVNKFGTKQSALSKISQQKKIKKGVYEKKFELAKKNRLAAREKIRKIKNNRQNFNTDLWGESLPEAKGVPETLCDDFISTDAQLHNVLPDRRLRSKPPLAKKLVSTPAVDAPHPGVSYNPTYQDHQHLLQNVVEREAKLVKKEEHLYRVTTKMFNKLTPAEKQKQWQAEMESGLPHTDGKNDNKEDAGNESGNEYKAVNPPVQNKKKDHKTRRKQKERLVELEKLKRAKIDKKKITDIYKLRKLQSSIDKAEQRQETERGARAERRARQAAAPPALSAHRVAAPEPELVEPSALSGDLRHLAPTSNLLRDRFESFQQRGALAGSKIMMKKKKRVKSYFKAGHKVTDQDVENYLKKAAAKK